MIRKNNIKDEPCELYNPDGGFMWTLNSELEFNDVRIQIKNQKLKGYYISFKGQRYEIDSDGRLPIYRPSGLFDTASNQMRALLYRQD
jgi:hypothetical protein